MKNFLVFAGETYYPGGGWSDFRGSYNTIEEASAFCDSIVGEGYDEKGFWIKPYQWGHVVDFLKGKVVYGEIE